MKIPFMKKKVSRPKSRPIKKPKKVLNNYEQHQERTRDYARRLRGRI